MAMGVNTLEDLEHIWKRGKLLLIPDRQMPVWEYFVRGILASVVGWVIYLTFFKICMSLIGGLQ